MVNDKKYLVIEELDSNFKVSEVYIDESNNIKLIDSYLIADISEVKKVSGNPYIIMGMNSDHATTIEKEIEIERLKPKKEVSENELDQLVFKSLWSFLNKYRGFASKKMSIPDLNVILSEVEIEDVTIGSQKILNPVGFKGEKIIFKLRGTLMSRKYLEYLDQLKDYGCAIKAVERLSVLSSVVSDADFVVHTEENNTRIFETSEDEMKYKKKENWGIKKVLTPISKMFNVSDSSLKILEKYFNGETSQQVAKKIKLEIKKPLESLLSVIKRITRKRNVKIYINTPEPIFNKALKDYKKAYHLNYQKILESRGFNVIIKPGKENDLSDFDRYTESLILSGIDLFSTHYQNLNKMLRRRSKWLVPHQSKDK